MTLHIAIALSKALSTTTTAVAVVYPAQQSSSCGTDINRERAKQQRGSTHFVKASALRLRRVLSYDFVRLLQLQLSLMYL